MCHRDDYAHILEGEPSPEERAAMAAIPQEPERRPRDVSGPFTEHAPTWMAGLPAAEDAFEFARGLVFGSAKVADRWFCRQHGWHKTGEAHR